MSAMVHGESFAPHSPNAGPVQPHGVASTAASLGSRWKRPSVKDGIGYVGEDGGFVGLSGFGGSGTEDQLFAHFGLTPERIRL
jgi:hypothetical protein